MSAKILYCSGDLMGTSQVEGAARAGGVSLKTIGSLANLADAIDDQTVAVIIELSSQIDRVAEVIGQIKEKHPQVRVLGHGPHVQVDRLETARQAGADEVLTNGQFHRQQVEILQALAKATS